MSRVDGPGIGGLVRRHLIAVALVVIVVVGYGYHLVHKNPGYLDAATVGFVSPINNSSVFSNYRGLLGTEEVTAWYMATPGAQQAVRAAGGTAAYKVALSNSFNEEYPDYGTPYVNITITSPEAAATTATFNAVMKVMANHLYAEQASAGAHPTARVTLLLASAPTGPLEQGGSHKRSLAGILVLALLLALLTASLLDRHRPALRGLWPGGRSKGMADTPHRGGGPASAPGIVSSGR
jgi:hypothetical protein